MHSFMWNGKSSADFGIMIEKDPDKNRPARKFSMANVAGRNGNLYDIQNSLEEVQRTYNLFCSVGNEPDIHFNKTVMNEDDFLVFEINKDNTLIDSIIVEYNNTVGVRELSLWFYDETFADARHYQHSFYDQTTGRNLYVYKGNFNLISNTLTITHNKLDLSQLTYVIGSSISGNVFKASISSDWDMPTGVFEAWSDTYKEMPFGTTPSKLSDMCYAFGYNNDELCLYIKDSRYSTATAFQENVSGCIIYPYSEPHVYQYAREIIEFTLDCGKYYIKVINGTLKKITKAVKPQNELITDIMEWLYEPTGYAQLSDTYDPDHYREAVLVDAVSVRDLFQKYGRAEVTFRCRPERFLTNDEVVLDLTDTVERLYINADTCRVRYDAGTGYGVIGTLSYGDIVQRSETVTIITNVTARSSAVLVYIDPDDTSEVVGITITGISYDVIGEINNFYHIVSESESIDGFCTSDSQYWTINDYITWAHITKGSLTGWVDNTFVASENVIVYTNTGRRVAKPIITITNDGRDELLFILNGVRISMIGHVFDELTIDCEDEDIRGVYSSGEEIIALSYNQYSTVSERTKTGYNATAKFPKLEVGENYFVVDGGVRSVIMHTREWEM